LHLTNIQIRALYKVLRPAISAFKNYSKKKFIVVNNVVCMHFTSSSTKLEVEKNTKRVRLGRKDLKAFGLDAWH